ncbi:MAG: replication-relaxation family protein [Chloroflexota bacterium]
MTTPFTWKDARLAADSLTPPQRRLLLLLARFPLLWAEPLQALSGHGGPASLYRTIDRLRTNRLLAQLRLSWRPGHSPALHYLTDLGLATLALDRGVEPSAIAKHFHLRGDDLLTRLPGWPYLAAVYELLALAVQSQAEGCEVLDWECPWRRQVMVPARRTPAAVQAPAYVQLGSSAGATELLLLLPDPGTVPLRAHRGQLRHLAEYSARSPHLCLLISTPSQRRADSWHALLEHVGREVGVAVPAGIVVRNGAGWSGVPHAGFARSGPSRAPRPLCLAPLMEGRNDNPLPAHVDLRRARTSSGKLGLAALGLTVTQRHVLDLLARHPFLSTGQLGLTLGLAPDRLGRLLEPLFTTELVRRLSLEERSHEGELLECTHKGLRLVAAQAGLTLSQAARFVPLIGGGPAESVGPRPSLVKKLAHTQGVNRLLASFRRPERPNADGLVSWQSEAAASRWGVFPDGYGVYRREGKLYGFFLEYDRGTMNTRGYARKLAAYYDYRDSGSYLDDYSSFPPILFVTNGNAAEKRFARMATAAARGRFPLLILLTVEGRVEGANNPTGLTGPIWRAPEAHFDDRQSWPFGICALEGAATDTLRRYPPMKGKSSYRSIKAAAEELRVSPAIIRRGITDRNIPAVQLHGNWRIPASFFEELEERAYRRVPAIIAPALGIADRYRVSP